jgi:hypothetical protein
MPSQRSRLLGTIPSSLVHNLKLDFDPIVAPIYTKKILMQPMFHLKTLLRSLSIFI